MSADIQKDKIEESIKHHISVLKKRLNYFKKILKEISKKPD